MKEINIVYSENYLKYDLGLDNPISKTKTGMFLEKLRKEGKIDYKVLEAPRAEEEDLLLVHTPRYLQELRRLADNNLDFDADTPVNHGMLEGGLYIIGGTILSLNLALQDERVVNLIGGMHHASSYKASGFCIYNDHAIAIRKLQKEGKIKKAIVYDLDVHAGQGTQEIFYHDASVMTVSIHQDPRTIYPGTGFEWQKGEGEGLGTNINIPLPPGTMEREYLQALDSILESTKSFSHDISILILGVDTYKEDFLGGMRLEKESFRKIGERFRNFQKLAILFGGGYSSKIPDLWMLFLKGYLGIN
ncbi:MAG: acetoin utilization protein AcuC [Patescibacteria group bacterium]|nr:MAG: acetoin utilization protein AcuC [Patescibacteria group bacterium]